MALRFDEIQLANTAHKFYPKLQGAGSAQYLQIQTSHGYLKLGANNSSYAHFYTDRGSYYFNKQLSISGNILSYDGTTTASFATYYDSNNTSYYLDSSSTGTSLNAAGSLYAAGGFFTNATGTLPLTTSTPYDYVAKFESTDGGAYVIIEDNSSTNNANRIGVAGNEMYLQTASTTAVTIDSSQNLVIGHSRTNKANIYGNLGIGHNTYPKIAYPGQNALWSGSGSTTGQIVIDLPGTLANYDMMYMEVDIYEYSSTGATKLIIGGHNWNSGGDSGTSNQMWHNINVQVVGALTKPVYLGWRNDGSNNRRVIAIGETNSAWMYATVHVAKVHGAEFYGTAIDWVADWNIAQTTSGSYFTKSPTTNWNDGGSYTLETNGIGEANHWYGSTSVRSPIFYDLDDTAYYLNPASTSNINNLTINGTLSGAGSFVPVGGGTFDGDVTFTGASHNLMWDKSENRLEFWDNAHLSFGDPGGTPDLLIYHDGSNSYIKEQGTGSLIIDASTLKIARNIVSNSTYNLVTMYSTRTIDDYGANINKDYMQLNLVTPGPDTDGGGSAHGYGAFSLKLANSGSNNDMAEVLNITQTGDATFLRDIYVNGGDVRNENSSSTKIWTTYNGTEYWGGQASVDYWICNTSCRAPKFIDTNNTAYHINPGSADSVVHTGFKINAPDESGSPAMTAILNMHGYEGRGVGIKMKDNVNSASGATDREWFVGTGYNSSGFNIGYASDGSQSSYAAQAKLAIATNGDAEFAGDITTTNGKLFATSDGSEDDGAQLYLKHANNNTADTIGTIWFGNNASNEVACIQATTAYHNRTSRLEFKTGDEGSISTAFKLWEDNLATFNGSILTLGDISISGDGGQLKFTPASYDDWEISVDSNGFVIYNTTDTRYDLKISGGGDATFGNDVDIPTKLVVGESATAEIRIKKTDAGYGKLSWYNNPGTSAQAAYISLDSDEHLYYYLPANKYHSFYGSGSERLRISGDVIVQAATDFAVQAGRAIRFDGMGHTYIKEETNDSLKIYVGGTEHMEIGGGDIFCKKPVQVESYIYHIGDTSTNMRFETSQITIRTAGDSHIQINNDENIYFRTAMVNRFKMDTSGNFIATADIIAYGSVSDVSYKENIKPITGALNLVDKLQGVTFDWKEDTDTNKMVGIKEDIGFIAQDVEKVLPTLVRENENGKLSIRDKGIVPVLVEAIKELKAEIEELKKQIK